MTGNPFWLPEWWDWEDWSDCSACLEQFGAKCPSCEVPPGYLAILCLVGGGTTVAAGAMRGNVALRSAQQARAASRVSGAEAVQDQLADQAFAQSHVQVDGAEVDATDVVNITVKNNLERNTVGRR